MRSVDETGFNVLEDGHTEEHGFLRDETDLRSQPFDVQSLHIPTIKLDYSGQGIVESLDQGDYTMERECRS